MVPRAQRPTVTTEFIGTKTCCNSILTVAEHYFNLKSNHTSTEKSKPMQPHAIRSFSHETDKPITSRTMWAWEKVQPPASLVRLWGEKLTFGNTRGAGGTLIIMMIDIDVYAKFWNDINDEGHHQRYHK
jgi:hypothetical protein